MSQNVPLPVCQRKDAKSPRRRAKAVHKSQVLTYLRLTKLKLGLVLNFGQKFLRNGIERVVFADS